jgi:hypothetical protein
MESSRSWGPEHQERPAPGQSRGIGRRIALGLVVVWVGWWWGWLHPGSHPFATLIRDGLIVGALVVGYRFLASRAAGDRESDVSVPESVASSLDPLGSVRDHATAAGGGAYLGANRGAWVFADPEHGVLLLGPPRSGKTSGVVIPALLAAPGACVSTSTKLDVLHATLAARRRSGEVWLFDPTGEHTDAGVDGVRRLSWSPVAAAGCWDEALLMARAMTLAAPAVGKGTQSEQHWSERAGALLAPLLLAANRSERPIADVVRWVLRHDLNEPGAVLEREQADVACEVLEGIARTDQRERSSIFSATAGVLALYSTDSAREAAAVPNFDPDEFAASSDTVFITAPAHRQALCAPLVVGLLEQIRHATYRRAASGARGLPVFLCLDEVANIAPIHDLPALVSEAGGQGLHVLACLQDLSQARARWGDQAADGFLSLFQTKLILPGVCDPEDARGRQPRARGVRPPASQLDDRRDAEQHEQVEPGDDGTLGDRRVLDDQAADTLAWRGRGNPGRAGAARQGRELGPPERDAALRDGAVEQARTTRTRAWCRHWCAGRVRCADWSARGRGCNPPGRDLDGTELTVSFQARTTIPEHRGEPAPGRGARDRLIGARGVSAASPLVDANRAAELMQVPPSWLLSQARAGQVPHHVCPQGR